MRPALLRLLSRPSSLDLLRYLVGPLPTTPGDTPRRKRVNRGDVRARKYANAAWGRRPANEVDTEGGYDMGGSSKPEDESYVSFKRSKEPRTYRRVNVSWGRQPIDFEANEMAEGEYTKDTTSSRVDKEAAVKRSVETMLSLQTLGDEQSSCGQAQAPGMESKEQASLIRHVKGSGKMVVRDATAYGIWESHPWRFGELHFESSIDQPSEIPRLLDHPDYKEDLTLWAFLLDYRRKMYGSDGVAMFWEAFRTRQVRLPPNLPIKTKLWQQFLNLGVHNEVVLVQVVDYVEKLWDPALDRNGVQNRWKELYTFIVGHFLLHGLHTSAIHWHNILRKHDIPENDTFGDLCHKVIKFGGKLSALRIIYHQRPEHTFYSKIVPTICCRGDFKLALKWHFICMQHSDFPSSFEDVEHLLRLLRAHDVPNARLVTNSLVNSRVPFASSFALDTDQKSILSREFVNKVHGQMMNIQEKPYNDSLGARWFATTWVSLDVAIKGIHALGMQEIGPLSLHAIALREPDAASICNRISQLKGLGITIGNSLFSRAVDAFSRNRDYQILESLLNSDQHPDGLEDQRLQEDLLLSYASANDWVQYRRTLAVQALRGSSSTFEKHNMMLRVHAARHNSTGLIELLGSMLRNRTSIHVYSVSAIVRCLLRRRQVSRRPVTLKKTSPAADIKLAVYVLKSIMQSGNYVPPSLWKEILLRLGMQRQFQALENLSLFLVSSYSGVDNSFGRLHSRHHQLSVRIPRWHHKHPLKIIFPELLQGAIVEWGFISVLSLPEFLLVPSTDVPRSIPDVTAGIKLLKKLDRHGVITYPAVIKKAIMNRLIAYYGSGESHRLHNRAVTRALGFRTREEAAESLDAMTKQINDALDTQLPSGVRMLEIIDRISVRRSNKRELRDERRINRQRYGLLNPVGPLTLD